jgi:DNA-binding IclR family transcriptional regulator
MTEAIAQVSEMQRTGYSTPRDELASRGFLGRAVGLIKFISDHGSASLPEMAVATGLPKSSVHRLARELASEGVLLQRGNSYTVAPLVFEFGLSSPDLRQLREVARPVMEDVNQLTHHTVHLAILVEDEEVPQALILEKIMGRPSSVVSSRVGIRVPLHSTATGKVLLAFSGPKVLDRVCAAGLPRYGQNTLVTRPELHYELERVRKARFAIANQEGSEGTKCVAAPIFDGAQRLTGALSITVTGAATVDFGNLGSVARMAARGVSRELQHGGAQVKAAAAGRDRLSRQATQLGPVGQT